MDHTERHSGGAYSERDISTIDLHTVPVYILTPDTDLAKYVHRRNTVKSSLVASGFPEENIHFVKGVYDPSDVVKSCSIGHALAIELALQAQFRSLSHRNSGSTFQPFLILEDDALPEADISTFALHYPSTADAIYPSMASDSADLAADTSYTYSFDSTYITQPGPPFPFAGNPPLVRIFNMLTSHACLVLSLRWALNWLRCATEGATRRCGFDVLVAFTMREYEVYAQTRPWFYQAEVIGGKEFETRLVLEGQKVDTVDEVPRAQMECVSGEIARVAGRVSKGDTGIGSV